MKAYSFKKVEEIFEELGSSEKGLSKDRVSLNKEKYGENIITQKGGRTYVSIFFSQFNNLFNHVLLIAALIVYFLDDFVDFFVIVGVILVNAVIGFIQEGRAHRIFEVLQKNIKSEALVIRDEKRLIITDEEVVVGDILVLRSGDKISADARLIEVNGLRVNESTLTGESKTVLKNIEGGEESTGVSDQVNMVFRGTYVVSGLAKAIVVRVGNQTEIGKVAAQVEGLEVDLPIKKTIKNLSKIILLFVVIFSVLTFIFGVGHGNSIEDIFLIVVALFVSAIPESLPVALTLVLASGFYRMSKKNVLIKRLQAVDALGQASIVALDKTGTITKNQMKVEKVFANGRFYYVSGDGYEPIGKIICDENSIDIFADKAIELSAKIAASTSIGDYSFSEDDNQWVSTYGDPTEVALLVFAEKLGVKKEELLKQYPIIKEFPFDMDYRHHSVIEKVGDDEFLYVSGSPETILEASVKLLIDGEEVDLDEVRLNEIKNSITDISSGGYRMLVLAYKKNPGDDFDPNNLSELVFVATVGINDTIRSTVEDSVKALENAGMKVVMITGDFKDTAIGIARKVGIWKEGDNVLTGKDINTLSDRSLINAFKNTTVFARVTPEQKLKIINLYKKRGETIAMTGDGVNDVLSLVKADLGVSMGTGATDVAKEAADIILLDNNFGNLAHGVLEGRNIYTNIKKTTEYLLSTNIAELAVILFSVVLGLPVALTAVQILWLNLVTDTFLVAGFAFEPLDKSLSKIKKWKPSKYLIDKKSLFKIILLATVMTITTLIVFVGESDLLVAQTMALSILTIIQFYNVYNIKAGDKSIFKTSIFNNIYLLVGIVLSATLYLFAMYNGFMQKILGIIPIGYKDWIFIISFGLIIIVADEIRKFFLNKN